MPKPVEGEWLAQYKEKAQSFKKFVTHINRKNYFKSIENKQIILQPIDIYGSNNISISNEMLISLTEYINLFFKIKVKLAETININENEHKFKKYFRDKQFDASK